MSGRSSARSPTSRPSRSRAATIDARADIYSLGCVLFECLTGEAPFARESELAAVYAHINEPPPRASDVRPDLPAGFDDVLAKALAKAPGDRYAELCRARRGKRPRPCGGSVRTTGLRAAGSCSARLAAAVALAAIAAFAVVRHDDGERRRRRGSRSPRRRSG